MRRIMAIASLHLKQFVKSPGAWVLMVVMPVLFGGIFGAISINSQSYKPLVNIVAGNDAPSKEIVRLLKMNEQFQWEKTTEDKAKENVRKQKVVAAVIIPNDTIKRINGNQPLFDVIVQRKTEDYLGLRQHLEGTARLVDESYGAVKELDANAFPELLKAVSEHPGVKVNQKIIQNDGKQKQSGNLMFVGFAIMFMMFGISGAASTILDEKKEGTWARLFVSPASKLEISLGYLAAYFLTGWVQLAALMIAMKIIFDTEWGNLFYLIPFASLVILCVIGFGLMIAGVVKTKKQAGAISAVVIVSTCMLGGVYWPLDFVPEVMQKIALAVPQSWAMSGFAEIIGGSLHAETLAKDAAALFIFTIAFFSVGLRLLKYD
jgi:ABC-2 type transport system permease protein